MYLILFQLFVFIFSAIVHEVAHGVMALRLGDTTARDAGRLTLNPLIHLEWFGSFVLPLMLYFISSGAMIFGWAKPVPYDPRFLRDPKRDAALIAAAGPLTNLCIALCFGLLIRWLGLTVFGAQLQTLLLLLHVIVLVNVLLGVFNLLPLTPLDGARILFGLLPARFVALEIWLSRYSFFILLVLIFAGFNFIEPIVFFLYTLFVGQPLLF